jgi:hypothetical protein
MLINGREFLLLRKKNKKKQTLIQMWGKMCLKWFLAMIFCPRKQEGICGSLGFRKKISRVRQIWHE